MYQKQQSFIQAFEKLEKDKRIFSENKNQLESFVSQLKDIVASNDKKAYLTPVEQETFAKRAEEIDDYVTFISSSTTVDEIKAEIFKVDQMLRPY